MLNFIIDISTLSAVTICYKEIMKKKILVQQIAINKNGL